MPAERKNASLSVLNIVLAYCIVLPAAYPVAAQERSPATRPSAAELAARSAYEHNLATYGKDARMLVRPGLLASRKDQTVRIWARATGISSDDPLEFILIPPDSGKDYEAAAVAFVKPSDVHAALEFIGMKPGRPVNYGKDQYWPKGERVVVHMEWEQQAADPPNERPQKMRARAEDLIVDVRTGKTLPREGFVFAGSFRITPAGADKPVYAADEMDSKSIISDFNDRSTVMDVPRQAPQSAVYGTQKWNARYKPLPGQPVQFVLEPEHKDGKLRVRDLTLRISMPAGGKNPQAGKYTLLDGQKQIGADDSLLTLLASFGQLTDAGQDPFVTVHVSDSLQLAAVQSVYAMLSKLDNESGIRIDAPPQGHLYYRAFFPKDEWRDRSKRLGRPWELHLVERSRKLAGTLILPADEIENNEGRGDLKWTVGSADEMAGILAEKSNKFSQTVYIFAPASMEYGALMGFIRPSMKTHTMYVFLPAQE